MVHQENDYVKLNIKFNQKTLYCPDCGSVIHIPKLYVKINELYNKYRKSDTPAYEGTTIVLWGKCPHCGVFVDYDIECHKDESLGFSAYLKKANTRRNPSNDNKELDILKEENKTIISNVKLEKISDIHTFITLMGTVGNKIDVCSEGYVVNGKSVMGIYSLNLSEPLIIKIYGEVPQSFIDALKEFVA